MHAIASGGAVFVPQAEGPGNQRGGFRPGQGALGQEASAFVAVHQTQPPDRPHIGLVFVPHIRLVPEGGREQERTLLRKQASEHQHRRQFPGDRLRPAVPGDLIRTEPAPEGGIGHGRLRPVASAL